MKQKITCFIMAILIMPFAVKAEEVSLTLDETITIALRDNRDILLKTEDLKKAKAGIAEAEAGLYPTLSVGAAWTDTRGLYSKDVGVTSGSIGIRQVLYKGGKIINAIKVSEFGYQASEAALDKAKSEIILNVKNSFYTLLLTQELNRINKAILDNTKAHLEFINVRYKNGQASESDLLGMEAALSDVKQGYELSVNQMEAMQELLRNILYLEKEVVIIPNEKLKSEPREVAFDDALLKALKDRPEIRQLQAQQNAAEKNIEIAKGDSRPSVVASWDYYSRSNLSGGTAKNWNDYNVLGITVSWPVFDGWLTRSKVNQAIIDLRQAQILGEKAAKDIALELKTAYLDLKDAIEKIKSADDQLKVYKDGLSVIQAKYEAGIASLLDLEDATLSYNVALFNREQAVYDYLTAKAGFEKAAGGWQ
jgi:outer membrane protein TolC